MLEYRKLFFGVRHNWTKNAGKQFNRRWDLASSANLELARAFLCDFHDLFDVIGGLFTRPSKSRTALSDGAIKGKSYSVFVKRLDLVCL